MCYWCVSVSLTGFWVSAVCTIMLPQFFFQGTIFARMTEMRRNALSLIGFWLHSSPLLLVFCKSYDDDASRYKAVDSKGKRKNET